MCGAFHPEGPHTVSPRPGRRDDSSRAAEPGADTAPTRAAALDAVGRFAETFASHPKAITKVTGDLDALLAFYDFPAGHAIHLRTTNPIESTFSTVRLRTRVTKGADSREAGLAMAFKLLDAAQDRWRKVNAPHLVALVRAGARFIEGQLQERGEPRPDEAGRSGGRIAGTASMTGSWSPIVTGRMARQRGRFPRR